MKLDDGPSGFERFAYLIARIPPRRPIRVLDVGCSECLEGEALLAAGLDLTGVDQDEVSVRRAGLRLPSGTFVCADAGDLPQAWRGRFGVIVIRRPDIVAQPSRWHRVFGRLSLWLSGGGRIIVTTVSAHEAVLVATWLEDFRFMIIDREATPMSDERMIVMATEQENSPVQDEGTPPARKVVKWDDGEGAPTCDLETGECSN